MGDTARYKPVRGIESWVVRALLVASAASGIALGLRVFDLFLLDRLEPGNVLSQAYLSLTDLLWALLNLGYTAALLGWAVALSWWVVRMVRNTEALAGGRIRATRQSWMWFWVPGPNLVMPVWVVEELWTINRIGRDRVRGAFTRASVDRAALAAGKPRLVALWWAAVLIAAGVERAGEWILVRGPTDDVGLPQNIGLYLAMGANLAGIAASLLGIQVVRRIGRLQREWEERLPTTDAEPRDDRALRVSPLRSSTAA
jgi:hypothetical protein